jgi:hypothetical protein
MACSSVNPQGIVVRQAQYVAVFFRHLTHPIVAGASSTQPFKTDEYKKTPWTQAAIQGHAASDFQA